MTDSYLRPLRAEDSADIFAAFASHHDMERQGSVTSESDARAYLERALSSGYAFGVEVDGQVVACVGLTVDAPNRLAWCWYWTHADHRGAGLASRATRTVANWALSEGGFERLELGHRVNNPASGRVALAAGFVGEGLERKKLRIEGERVDVRTYGRLATDPVPTGTTLPADTSTWPPLEA
ncbi:MAG: GNAT family protein [Bowdeniella nasicola]|nr:GNAT family protein [Bowdeniella nasicola]